MGATVTQTMMQIPEAKLLCDHEDSTIVSFIVVVVVRPLSHFPSLPAAMSPSASCERRLCDAQPHDDTPAYR
ncbi:hypothetical protein CMUS01_09740 [Colletotrichum musicola]|uniref:Uncharacterized protein n=1 Tax=Colletotrichum musicola TaxID=2175873 RepID=A0A8H6K6J6_9PEZI|nr:hypothetical protein CMUS01_09740 [Colletotrichum musicola]